VTARATTNAGNDENNGYDYGCEGNNEPNRAEEAVMMLRSQLRWNADKCGTGHACEKELSRRVASEEQARDGE
jgi:hypothetical protein